LTASAPICTYLHLPVQPGYPLVVPGLVTAATACALRPALIRSRRGGPGRRSPTASASWAALQRPVAAEGRRGGVRGLQSWYRSPPRPPVPRHRAYFHSVCSGGTTVQRCRVSLPWLPMSNTWPGARRDLLSLARSVGGKKNNRRPASVFSKLRIRTVGYRELRSGGGIAMWRSERP